MGGAGLAGDVRRGSGVGRPLPRRRSLDTSYPEHDLYRPASTDTDGDFLTFWEVTNLERLPDDEALPLATLTGWKRTSKLGQSFIPKGPMLIHNPY